MEQYHEIKKQHKEEILFFRLGDFYEMFYEDARIASRVLGIVLTSRFKGEKVVPMAGIPYHAASTYITRFLKAGYRIAICEQVEDKVSGLNGLNRNLSSAEPASPAGRSAKTCGEHGEPSAYSSNEAQGLVERAVVRVVTPGTLTEEGILDAKTHNFLAALTVHNQEAGLAWLDISTGEFKVADFNRREALDELQRINPVECLIPDSFPIQEAVFADRIKQQIPAMLTTFPAWAFERTSGYKTLTGHFQTANLSGFGCEGLNLGIAAAGALLEYLRETQKLTLGLNKGLRHITKIEPVTTGHRIFLDRITQLSLELTQTLRSNEVKDSLLGVLDKTFTPMGARLLRDWITTPLAELNRIQERQAAIKLLYDNQGLRQGLQPLLKNVSDIERICAKLGTNRANPRDIVNLKNTVSLLPDIKTQIAKYITQPAGLIKNLQEQIGQFAELRQLIESALVEQPPAELKEGGIFKPGYNQELDELKNIGRTGKDWINRFQAAEIERTGISSLKIGFNQVFGYFLEVTNVHKEKIPANYIRKQTLKNAERYITPELKDYETQVLHAEERSQAMEYELFLELREQLMQYIPALQTAGRALALLDVLLSLADVAQQYNYCLPEVNDSLVIKIQDGRHPVLEQVLDEKFIANDFDTDGDTHRVLIITGPNMAGKSTYIRQVALIILMAQMGSFIPARSASIGIVDRIFTRVGASDELTRGASTFMVEMNETANIINNATNRSLIVLDEVGRGTSTFDGVSIAWAVTEYIHDRLGSRTLFATHYHELTELALILPGVKNYHIAVKEWGEKIIFLRKIVEGGTDKSYGIQVARLAGIPPEVLDRAKEILVNLEAETLDEHDRPRFAVSSKYASTAQMNLFGPLPHPIADILKKLDLHQITPIQAMTKLQELKDLLKQ
jgi:DNA mismatch repair protein MutS